MVQDVETKGDGVGCSHTTLPLRSHRSESLSMSEIPEHRRLGLVELILWSVGVVAVVYFGFFALLLCDHFAFSGAVIENPLRQVNPALSDQVGEVIRVVYAPLLWGMRNLGLIPD